MNKTQSIIADTIALTGIIAVVIYLVVALTRCI